MKNALRERWREFIGALSSIGGIGYLLFSVMESRLMSEAQKYFALSLVIFIIIIAYIELVVRK
jgi:hypothetical protein